MRHILHTSLFSISSIPVYAAYPPYLPIQHILHTSLFSISSTPPYSTYPPYLPIQHIHTSQLRCFWRSQIRGPRQADTTNRLLTRTTPPSHSHQPPAQHQHQTPTMHWPIPMGPSSHQTLRGRRPSPQPTPHGRTHTSPQTPPPIPRHTTSRCATPRSRHSYRG